MHGSADLFIYPRLQDAEKAIEMGIDGIIVSNHGGRQVDGAIASLDALAVICATPRILAAQKVGMLTVLFDSGVRSGSDVIKAMALGAQGVLCKLFLHHFLSHSSGLVVLTSTVGRPYVYGLAAGGEKGVEHVIRTVLADLELSMGLSGFRNLGEIQGRGEEVMVRI